MTTLFALILAGHLVVAPQLRVTIQVNTAGNNWSVTVAPALPPLAAVTTTNCTSLAAEIWANAGGVGAAMIQPDGAGLFDKTAAQTQNSSACDSPFDPGLAIRN